MLKSELQKLKTGDIIRSKLNGISYVVMANYGEHITVVRTVDVTNEHEWDLVEVASYVHI